MNTTQILCGVTLAWSLAACDEGKAKPADDKTAAQAEQKSEAVVPATPEADGQSAADGDANVASVSVNIDGDGRALHGHDPVTYHAGEPLMGKPEHELVWEGVTWQFASAENKRKFEAEPKKYAPQNGGFCTFGVVVSKKLDADPTVWQLSEDKLYVFLNPEMKDKFLQDEAANFAKVETNWPIIKDKKPEELE